METTETFDPSSIDTILDKTIATVNESKEQIFEIGEQSREEFEKLSNELKEIRESVHETIHLGDVLETKSRLSRAKLAEVSKHFERYNEHEIKRSYEVASEYQVQLISTRQKEASLRERRDDIERRIRQLEQTIERAEQLVSQISVVLTYLDSDLRQVGAIVKDAKAKQDFGLQIIEAQEEERARVSREIHDGPAQMLANVLLRSELIEKTYMQKGIDQARNELNDLRQMVKEALTEVRRIIYDLRPMALDDLGLVPTLEKYLRTLCDSTGIDIQLRSFGNERRLPSRMEVATYRLIQESVQNACKHAQAEEVQVKIEFQDNLSILVRDDGVGFDPSKKKDKSFGLVGMKERVELLKGTMKIDTTPGKGTLIFIQIPLKEQEAWT
ncbi:sensor histidine kinase [Pseudalkalibacillus berkeleyi]|uniref:Signal transduction histidine-protein kinase/phosphatase DegS n=1 Tax=Pseudalkalibacillus berkeleyi TaxID=1069813 RepID=A0ABS9H476_9BACL|nr:sensor histidine kinase [Pseudalkalibacillus berkeleyi]MCF6138765.1 sensor histidine kinase [Pseudalkalibacillus berkeleyi]